jgi:hypothetical protein
MEILQQHMAYGFTKKNTCNCKVLYGFIESYYHVHRNLSEKVGHTEFSKIHNLTLYVVKEPYEYCPLILSMASQRNKYREEKTTLRQMLHK